MKSLQNPTSFFFKQAEQLHGPPSQEILDFASKLYNQNKCELCNFNYDILTRIPRVLVHCGHTFCTYCLKKFHINRRVRCPTCLKLVKQIDKVERLPINHTIFALLVEADKKKVEGNPKIKPLVKDAKIHLYGEFERVHKQSAMKQKKQKIDEETNLPYCVFHPERIEHFYCAVHSSAVCRACSQTNHNLAECKVVDLYEIKVPEIEQKRQKERQKEEIYNSLGLKQIHFDRINKPDPKGVVIIGSTGVGRTVLTQKLERKFDSTIMVDSSEEQQEQEGEEEEEQEESDVEYI